MASMVEDPKPPVKYPFPIGSRVELRDLQRKPELNGRRGVVVGFDVGSGRCVVEVDNESGSGPLKLKPEKLTTAMSLVGSKTLLPQKLPLDEETKDAVFTALACGDVKAMEVVLDESGESRIRAVEAQRVILEYELLFIAACNGSAQMVALLLGIDGIDVNAVSRQKQGVPALAQACLCGHSAVVELLLAHDSILVNKGNNVDGRTALITACDQGFVKVVKILLDHPAIDVNQATTDNGTTPLLIACFGKHKAVVQLLLKHPAIDVNQARTDIGKTPLYVACERGATPLVEMLLAHATIDVNKPNTVDGATPLFIACHEGHVTMVELLLALATIDVNIPRAVDGATPLFIACHAGHVIVAKLLLAHDSIDVNRATTKSGYTPLIAASEQDRVDMVKLLLSHPLVDVNQLRADDGSTALFGACLKGNTEVVRLLLEHGADKHIKDVTGATALKVARRYGRSGVVALLKCPISIGARVELRGLQTKPELNGLHGVVVDFQLGSGRCKVRLGDGRGVFRLKPVNLVEL